MSREVAVARGVYVNLCHVGVGVVSESGGPKDAEQCLELVGGFLQYQILRVVTYKRVLAVRGLQKWLLSDAERGSYGCRGVFSEMAAQRSRAVPEIVGGRVYVNLYLVEPEQAARL